VRRCWLKNLIKKVKEWPLRARMFQTLGHIMNMRSDPNDNLHDIHDDVWELLQQFYNEFSSEEAFIQYFKAEWEPKIGETFYITYE
jgi:hypothetical protein